MILLSASVHKDHLILYVKTQVLSHSEKQEKEQYLRRYNEV